MLPQEKLKEMKINNLDDIISNKLYVDGLYKIFIKNKNNTDKNKKIIKKHIIIDKNTKKYKIFLKFINKILVNIGKDEIDDLVQFKNINRVDIIKPENKVILEEMAPKLFTYFDKRKSGYYRKSPNIVHNVIRCMCRDLKISFIKKKKAVYERINNISYRRTGYFYTMKYI